MKETFGYKPLSWELIELLTSGAPDFVAAEELIQRGADVNDQGNNKGENVLSDILWGYWQSFSEGNKSEECRACNETYDICSSYSENPIQGVGPAMISVIRFFLDHGFDVHRDDGRYGAQCLNALHLSSFDESMIEAAKILLDAGAQDIPVDDDPEDTPQESFIIEQSFQDTTQSNHYLGNIYEAVLQIFAAKEKGRPYTGIDWFRAAVGKRIDRVMADADPGTEVFYTAETDTYHHDNCFRCNLYFVFDGGFFLYEREASCYVDTCFPDTPLIDVSDSFPDVVGCTLDDITFSHHDFKKRNTKYGQPITILHLSNGKKLTFTINFGEEDRVNYCTYYYYS